MGAMSSLPARAIPITLQSGPSTEWARPLPLALTGWTSSDVQDAHQRPLHDLRISVTDRCNFRCTYCMPRASFGPQHAFLPHTALLTFEEIRRVASLLLPLGVRKLRLTGGEPLMRKDLAGLIAMLSELRSPEGRAPEIALTTNGSLLPRHASALRSTGLDRITVSLDALDDAIFQRMSDTDTSVAQVLHGIACAQEAGLKVKVNMVVQRGTNDDQLVPMVRHFRGTGVTVRFIEFMDVGETNRWDVSQVLSAKEMQQRIETAFPLVQLPRVSVHDTATRWAHADGQGEIGFIASVTQAFCGSCSRLRLSTDGRLYTCLFAQHGYDLRTPLRSADHDDEQLQARLAALWLQRSDQYSALRHTDDRKVDSTEQAKRVEMSFIGG